MAPQEARTYRTNIVGILGGLRWDGLTTKGEVRGRVNRENGGKNNGPEKIELSESMSYLLSQLPITIQ